MTPRTVPCLPGWYDDPTHEAALRYWDGQAWSPYVAELDVAAKEDALRLRHELGAFLDYLGAQGLITRSVWERLDLERLKYAQRQARVWQVHLDEATAARAGHVRSTEAPATVPKAPAPSTAAPAPPVLPPPTRTLPAWPVMRAPRVAAPQVPRGPTAGERFRHAVGSDLALHGMAYLGILLLFAGVTGFVVFAWGDVERNLRPVAEVAIPVTLFLAGWYLRRRGANVVGGTLVLGGGAVLPIVTVAALVDGAAVPPDVAHGGLVLAATLTVAALAAVYAVVGTCAPTSPLRYLAAPTLWLAVGIAALAPSSSELAGEAIARIGAAQFAAVAVALAATSILSRLFPDHPLSRPTMIAAVGGIVVVAAALRSSPGPRRGGRGSPAWSRPVPSPSCSRVWRRSCPPRRSAPCKPCRSARARPALGGGIGPGWAAAVATGSFLVLLGWQSGRRPGPVAMGTAAGGVLVAAGLSLVEPWAAVVAFGLLTVAAHVARHRRVSGMPAGVLTGVAAVAPLGIAVGLFGALSPGVAATVLGAGVVLEAIGVRLTGRAATPSSARGSRALPGWWPLRRSCLLPVCLLVGSPPRVASPLSRSRCRRWPPRSGCGRCALLAPRPRRSR